MENAYIVPGGVGYWSVVHEVGHALGLSGDKGLGASLWHGENNSVRYTVMSYNQLPQLAGNGPGGSNPAPNAPMLLDIAAIQYLYGANALTNYGAGSHYEFRTVGGWPVQAIWDAGGDHDIIDASTKSNNVGGDGDDHARAHLVDLWAR
jgi:hypothetical protein